MCSTDGELQTYLDGEMETNRRDALVRHLAECSHCRGRAAAAAQRRGDIADVIGDTATELQCESAGIALARFHARVAAGDRGRAFAAVFKIGYATCAIALAVLAFAVFAHSKHGPGAPGRTSHAGAEIAPPVAPAARQSAPAIASGDSARTAPPARSRAHRARPGAVADTYLLLADDLTPPEMGIVVRVRMPLSILGAAISAEPRTGAEPQIEADVLVGQDGRARAIRFVNQLVPSGGK